MSTIPSDGLMKTDKEVGIVGYGSYVPRYRLPAERGLKNVDRWQKAAFLLRRKLSTDWTKTSSVCPLKLLGMRLARAEIDPQEIRAVWVGSESHPYAVKPTSTIVAESIGAVPRYPGC